MIQLPCDYTCLLNSDYDNFQFSSDAHDNLILLGDFDFPGIDWVMLSGHSTALYQLCDLIFQAGPSQLINVPTHKHGNILDLLFTNTSIIYPDPHLQSDHYNIIFSLTTGMNLQPNFTTYFSFNFSKGDYQSFCDF